MPATQGMRELLRNPTYVRVWMIGLFTGIARWLDMLVVGIFAFELTASPFLVALLVVLRMIPLALFGSVMGAFSDRVRPRRLLRIGIYTAWASSAVICVLAYLDVLAYWHVALATFVSGLVWTTDMPVRRRILGDAAGGVRIVTAMSLDSATNNGTRLLGPLLGGLTYQWLGMAGAFTFTMSLHVLCGLLVAGLPAAISYTARTERLTKMLREIQEAYRYAVRDRDILRILAVTVVFNVWGFPFLAMMPVIGKDELQIDAAWIGVITATEGGGAFLGALVVVFSTRAFNLRRLYYFGTIGYLVFAFVVGWMADALPMAVALLCAGLAGAGFSTMQSTLIYSIAPPEMRGRLFGLVSLCIGTGIIGFANVGLMGEWFGGSMAVRIIAAEGLIPLILIGLGWRHLWRGQTQFS